MLKLIICWFLGHDPRGPIRVDDSEEPKLLFYRYQCDRCKQLIYFYPEKGWKRL